MHVSNKCFILSICLKPVICFQMYWSFIFFIFFFISYYKLVAPSVFSNVYLAGALINVLCLFYIHFNMRKLKSKLKSHGELTKGKHIKHEQC